MENAASALQMAAGLLLALLLLSLLVFVFNSINSSENTKQEMEVAKENSEFNKKFSAFDKSSMYGTDVVSILGLAISNNEKYKQMYTANPNGVYDPDVDGTINIKFTLKSEVKSKKITYEYKSTLNPETRKYDTGWVETENSPTTILNAGTYTLENESTYETIRKIAVEGNQNVVTKITGTKKTETDTSGFEDFKKRVFTCSEVKYNGAGRINYMEFTEKDT